jgi:hypothetical protein
MSQTLTAAAPRQLSFAEELHEQRWDDHRYYHQSRINQSLHLFSACCFLLTYAMLPFKPALAAVFGWIVPMWVRQIGHFFFEPKGFDQVNNASFEHKEEIKVGFNLQRKVILFVAWASVPAFLWFAPTVFGLVPDHGGVEGWVNRVGSVWLVLAAIGLVGRSVFLAVTRSPQTGLVWFTKILTDPFHDIKMYHKAPLFLMRGQLIDPMDHVNH